MGGFRKATRRRVALALQRRRADVLLVSFPKCGRTWVRVLLGRAMQQHVGLPAGTNLVELHRLADLDPRLPRILATHDDDAQWKRPADVARDKRAYRGKRVILLVRDPRDVVVSLYYQKRFRRSAYEGTLADFVDEPVGGFDAVLRFYDAWAAQLDVPADLLLVRYEDLHADPAAELRRMLDFVGLPDVPEEVVADAVSYASFDSMRQLEERDAFASDKLRPAVAGEPGSYKTRRGRVGGFRDELDAAAVARLDAKMAASSAHAYGYGPEGAQPRDDPPPFTFVVGCGRSGTTVLRTALDAHPALAVAHEAGFVYPLSRRRAAYERPEGFDVDRFARDVAGARSVRSNLGLTADEVRQALAGPPVRGYADAVRRVFLAYAQRSGKPRYGDKMPSYVLHVGALARFFPEARFVHIVRDGRDVALSTRAFEGTDRPMAELALDWRRRVEAGTSAGRALGPRRYSEVRYEELVRDPQPVLEGVCRFLGLEPDAAVLRHAERRNALPERLAANPRHSRLAEPLAPAARTWRERMSPAEVEVFEAVAGRTLDRLGYERASARPGVAARARGLAGVARHRAPPSAPGCPAPSAVLPAAPPARFVPATPADPASAPVIMQVLTTAPRDHARHDHRRE